MELILNQTISDGHKRNVTCGFVISIFQFVAISIPFIIISSLNGSLYAVNMCILGNKDLYSIYQRLNSTKQDAFKSMRTFHCIFISLMRKHDHINITWGFYVTLKCHSILILLFIRASSYKIPTANNRQHLLVRYEVQSM